MTLKYIDAEYLQCFGKHFLMDEYVMLVIDNLTRGGTAFIKLLCLQIPVVSAPV